MNKKQRLTWLGVMAFLMFVGLAVNANIYDRLEGTNYAYWLNIVGFCFVPIVSIGMYLWYRKEIKNLE